MQMPEVAPVSRAERTRGPVKRFLKGGVESSLRLRLPSQTAVSIAAEIIACQWGGGGRPLAQLGGRIHHEWGSDVGKRGSDYGSDPELSDSLTRY
ncbi:hypothetical protein MAGR_52130 [Mycolicibacterium agri]|uniref:Uncharacterized protein n=1 Tax=Mycolicibacterium agri TaxID=36811 RepID=A0A7I9W7W0_MYCAG|nr:hypothetical protein MAGR_52130 [Mycolicibacterium agri]